MTCEKFSVTSSAQTPVDCLSKSKWKWKRKCFEWNANMQECSMANLRLPSECTWIVCIHCCWPTLHNFIVPSELPEMIWDPSTDTTSAFTFSECPFNFMMRLHVRGSHIRSAFSVDPLTMIEPDGFIARLYIESLEPAKFDAISSQKCNS